MKKFILTVALMLAMGANAHAIQVEFDIVDLYSWGRVYSYDGGAGEWTPVNVNPYDGSFGSVITENTPGEAEGDEDTWGVAQIDQISPIGDPLTSLFDKDVDPYELTVIFYGFDDDFISDPSLVGTADLASLGGHVQVWKDFNQDYDPSLGTAGRTGDDAYTGATEGELVLDLVPVAQTLFGHTLVSSFNFANLTGDGTVYLSVTGAGSWDALYDTNTQDFNSDFLFQYVSRDNSNPTVANWVVRGDGRAESSVIPEPASMLLLGSGLVGMIGARRRKLSK